MGCNECAEAVCGCVWLCYGGHGIYERTLLDVQSFFVTNPTSTK